MSIRRLRPLAFLAALAVGCAGQQDSADTVDTADTADVGATVAGKGVLAEDEPGGGPAGQRAVRTRAGGATVRDVVGATPGPAGRAGETSLVRPVTSPRAASTEGVATVGGDVAGGSPQVVPVLVVEGDETWLYDCALPADVTRVGLFRDGLPAGAVADLQCTRDRQVGMRWPADRSSTGSGRVGLTVSYGMGRGPALRMPVTPSGDRAVDGTVKRYRARLARCMLAERSAEGTLAAAMSWRLDIADGRVRDVALVDGVAGPVADCVSDTLAAWRFPRRVVGAVVLDLSFSG